MSTPTTQQRPAEKQDFINEVKPIWCAGCGDFYVLDALAGTLAERQLSTSHTAVVTGIGCSSRIAGYMSCYGFNGIHGRPIPIATGLKLARPDITVIVASGDGDAFSIGGGHLIHGVRRGVDLTFIVMDNGIYGLTKGQASPTTPQGIVTKTSEGGATELPVNPLELMLTYGCGFVAQAYASDVRGMQELFSAAVGYPGFSFVNVISPCPTFRGGMGIYKELRGRLAALAPGTHDAADYDAALRLARDASRVFTGVLYQREPAADPAAPAVHEDKRAALAALAQTYR
jgi:2-oxoglutarate ferredoxin oxidoreductase subunit beta